MITPRGEGFIVKDTGGWLEGLSQNPQNIYPTIAMLKIILSKYFSNDFFGEGKLAFEKKNSVKRKEKYVSLSESSKISNLEQILIFPKEFTCGKVK